jgi:hypothetical protein
MRARVADPTVYLRAIELMLDEIDGRLPDDSMAPKPYEVTATEMRDVLRLARKGRPMTQAGRRAWQQALDERAGR